MKRKQASTGLKQSPICRLKTFLFPVPHKMSTKTTIAVCVLVLWCRESSNRRHLTRKVKKKKKKSSYFTLKVLKSFLHLFPRLLKESKRSNSCPHLTQCSSGLQKNLFTDALPLLMRPCWYASCRAIQRVHCLRSRRWNVMPSAGTSS